MKTLLLIDANSLIHRSFHALPPLLDPKGTPVNALYGLSSILIKLWREEDTEYAAAAFDRPEATFRKKKFKEYKATRPPAPDELISQIKVARDLFTAFGIKTYEKAGFEADDIIATLAHKFEDAKDIKIVILTGDKDTLQLIKDSKVVVRMPQKGISNTKTFNKEAVIEKYKLQPSQMNDYKAMVGDPSDNIKGVPGVGPKTAQTLLGEYKTLKNVLESKNDKDKGVAKVKNNKEDALQALDLVTLHDQVPGVPEDLEELKADNNKEKQIKYLMSLGFKTLVERLQNNKPSKNEEGLSQVAMF